MTGKQIEKAKGELRDNVIANGPTEQTRQLDNELSCRSMINSLLVYGYSPIGKDGQLNEYLLPYGEKNDIDPFSKHCYIGRERVLELIKEQQTDFEKAIVRKGVYTDNEDVTYNSVIWADEQ